VKDQANPDNQHPDEWSFTVWKCVLLAVMHICFLLSYIIIKL